MAEVEPTFMMARGIHLRELSSKSYSSEIFALGQVIAEIPYSILCTIAFFLPWYFLPGFPTEADRAGYAFLCQSFSLSKPSRQKNRISDCSVNIVMLFHDLYSVTLGQAVSALSPNLFIAVQVNPVLITVLNTFCGVYIPPDAIPQFWRGCEYTKKAQHNFLEWWIDSCVLF